MFKFASWSVFTHTRNVFFRTTNGSDTSQHFVVYIGIYVRKELNVGVTMPRKLGPDGRMTNTVQTRFGACPHTPRPSQRCIGKRY